MAQKVPQSRVNELFGLSARDKLIVKDKMQLPGAADGQDCFLVKLTHFYRDIEVWSSRAVVSEDGQGNWSDAGTTDGLVRNIDSLAASFDFNNLPKTENSLAACKELTSQTKTIENVKNAILKQRYLHVHDGKLVIADEIRVEGVAADQVQICFYDATNKKLLNMYSGIQTMNRGMCP